MNIYVGNLAKEVNEQDLEKAFSSYGTIKSVKVIRDLFSGESKGFGFVELNGQQGQTAINELNSSELKGKKIVVNEARPKNTTGGGGSNRGRRGNGSSGGGGGFNRNSGGRNRF